MFGWHYDPIWCQWCDEHWLPSVKVVWVKSPFWKCNAGKLISQCFPHNRLFAGYANILLQTLPFRRLWHVKVALHLDFFHLRLSSYLHVFKRLDFLNDFFLTVFLTYSWWELLDIDYHVTVKIQCCVKLEFKGQPVKQVQISDKLNILFSLVPVTVANQAVATSRHWYHLFHSTKKTQTKPQSKNRHPCVGPCHSSEQAHQSCTDMMVINNSSVIQQKDRGWDLCIYWPIFCPPFIYRQAVT